MRAGGAQFPDTIASRLALLDQRLAVSAGKSASDHVRDLFPELARLEIAETLPTIPTVAPELWADARKLGESVGDFVRRVYGRWIGHGLKRADLRALDRSLYYELYRPANAQVLAELGIPTLREYHDAMLARLGASSIESALVTAELQAGGESVQRLIGLAASRARKGRGPRP